MNRTIWLLLLIVAGAIAGVLYYTSQKTPSWVTAPTAKAPAAKPPPPEPEIRYPIEEKAPEKPLPELNKSDPAMKEALGGLWNEKTIVQFFNLNEFVRRIVATVDNLPRQKIALRLMPVKQAPGQFRTTGKGDAVTVSPDNAARYAPYVKIAESVDSAKLADLYFRFYPLFQQAYEDLGYPKAYFNDRLIEVIDHLLAAPEMQAGVKLVQPKVFYQFSDPDLEKRSAGQKIMMRIGNDNAARIKAKLRDLRGHLTRKAAKP
ncbi:MAG: DUF3014 domain-containing protein [Betaproteobacteria bacterium]